MPMWRCPHCGTPQSETARCWVCRRSSTACATCRNFRRSVAAQLGYCGLDAQRRPLRGDEIRACWDAPVAAAEAPAASPRGSALAPLNVVQDRTPVRRLEFVEVRSTPSVPRSTQVADPKETDIPDVPRKRTSSSPVEPSWSLWGDAEI